MQHNLMHDYFTWHISNLIFAYQLLYIFMRFLSSNMELYSLDCLFSSVNFVLTIQTSSPSQLSIFLQAAIELKSIFFFLIYILY